MNETPYAVFIRISETRNPNTRTRLLNECCPTERFRKEVEHRLAVFEKSNQPDSCDVADRELDYEIVGEAIASGGMGVVYRARQVGLDRIVALKVLSGGHSLSDEARLRFQQEVRMAASLEHDGLVRVYQAGIYEGNPAFTMEYVDGSSLAQFINDKRGISDPNGVATIIHSVAVSIQYAHEHRVIHRDIKPSNILLTRDGFPKVADFGVAKMLDSDGLTVTGAIVGTPSYMSPEQVDGHQDVGPQSDIYSIGAVLYELLTLKPPFRAASVAETFLAIKHDLPTPPCEINRAVPRDLETICLKCLEKSPASRYSSAQVLGDDLKLFLERKPILARRPSVIEKVLRWCGENRAVTGLITILALLLIATGLLALFALDKYEESEERGAQLVEAAKAEQELRAEAESQEYAAKLKNAIDALHAGRFDDVHISGLPESQIGWEAHLIAKQALDRPAIRFRLGEHSWGVLDGVLSPDGKRFVTSGGDGLVLLWDTKSGRRLKNLSEKIPARIQPRWKGIQHSHFLLDWPADTDWPPPMFCGVDLTWLGDTPNVVVASLDGTGAVINTETGEWIELLSDGVPLCSVASTKDGTRILFGSSTGRVSLVDVQDGKLVQSQKLPSESEVASIAWCESATTWIVGSESGNLWALDGESLEETGRTSVPGSVWSLDVSDSQTQKLIVGYENDTAQLWLFDVITDGAKTSFRSLKSRSLASGGGKTTAAQSVRFGTVPEHVYAFDDSGRLLLWELHDDQIRWDIQSVTPPNPLTGKIRESAEGRSWPFPMALHRSGRVSAVTHDAIYNVTLLNTSLVWEHGRNSLRHAIRPDGKSRTVPGVAFDDKGRLWMLSQEGTLEVVETQEWKTLDTVQLGSHGNALSRISNTDYVVTVNQAGEATSWQFDDGLNRIASGQFTTKHDRPLISVASSHDGKWIAAVDDRSMLLVWDVRTGSVVSRNQISQSKERPLSGAIAFSRNDDYVAAFGAGVKCGIYSTVQQPFVLEAIEPDLANGGGTALMWDELTPDLLFCADNFPRFASVRVSDETDTRELTGLRFPNNYPDDTCVTILDTPDGRRRMFLDENGQILVYDPRRLAEVYRFDAGPNACDMTMSDSGRFLAVAHDDGVIDVWDVANDGDGGELEVQASNKQWHCDWLIGPSDEFTGTDCPGVTFNGEGECAIAAVERLNTRQHELVFYQETEESLRRQVIQPNVVGPDSVAVAYEAGGEPTVVFRCLVPISPGSTKYTGKIRMARREAGEWNVKEVAGPGNFGFNIVSRVDNGRIADAFCFSFYRYMWLRLSRADRVWKTATFGRQGDGVRAHYFQDSGDLHGVFSPKRLLYDPGPAIYTRWDGTKLIREVVHPSVRDVYGIAIDRGNPVVVGSQNVPGGKEFYLLRRDDGQWRVTRLPVSNAIRGCVSCSPDGQTIVVGQRSGRKGLFVFEQIRDGWAASPLGKPLTITPSWCKVYWDTANRPKIVLGYAASSDDVGGVRICRPEQR